MGMDSVAQAVFGLADQIVIEPFLSFFGKSHMSLTKKRIINRSLVHLGRTIYLMAIAGRGRNFLRIPFGSVLTELEKSDEKISLKKEKKNIFFKFFKCFIRLKSTDYYKKSLS